ncbi:potassium channel family protein [Streptomyces sp. TLI_146]|uniref:potassium channel family protein n=1 Tax=Streptomyces sp. TLI_146 TaxID=1938858 RepID=UPI000C70BFA7|nr:potassium channel family protein [Streptomyces sp. TLI_146]PKV89311.1 ion channel [Streptomyces sp. TLI_146]
MERAGPEERRRRRALAGHLLRSAASVVLLTSLYYLAPLDRGVGVGTAVALALGLVLFGCLTVWQIAAITHAEYPRLRAIEALATGVPLFLVLFSATYFLLADDRPASFSEPLSRTGALYFTVTVFATVGFGDIAPATDTSRALTTAQMILDLIVVGVIAKALFGAVQVGLRRRDAGPEDPEEEP